MAERITIQDIADELGVSRNTVSKAINNTGLLAESTRQKVLKKARNGIQTILLCKYLPF